MSSVGGGGFALVRKADGAAEVVDYYDVMPGKGLPKSAFGAGGSPQSVTLKYGAGVESIVGGAAVSVPGSLRGWEAVLARHGRLGLGEALAPAVRLAREGFNLCRTAGMWFGVAEEVLRLTDETRRHFYTGDRVYREGEEIRFPELAETLEAVGEGGADLFYEGELGRKVSAYVLEMEGILTETDLAEYRPVIREPMSVRYGAGEMYTNGPPSAGGPTLAQMLKIVSAYDLASMPDDEYVTVVAGAMRLALEDRETQYLDGTRNDRVAARLTGEEYAKSQRQRIFEGFGSPQTSHLSCVDADGLAVSITASMGYGSGLVVPGTGIPAQQQPRRARAQPKGFPRPRPRRAAGLQHEPYRRLLGRGRARRPRLPRRLAHTDRHPADARQRARLRDDRRGGRSRAAVPRRGGPVRLRARGQGRGRGALRAGAPVRGGKHVLRRRKRRQAHDRGRVRGGGRSAAFGGVSFA